MRLQAAALRRQPYGFEGLPAARVSATPQDLPRAQYANQPKPSLDRDTAVPSHADEPNPRGDRLGAGLDDLFNLGSPFLPDGGHVGEPAAEAVMAGIHLGSGRGRQADVLDAWIRDGDERLGPWAFARAGCLDEPPHGLHVLVRHRPPSIAPFRFRVKATGPGLEGLHLGLGRW